MNKVRIDLQRHTGEAGQGITDIEIHLPGHFHVIVEAKVGLSIPTVTQCLKYLPRFANEPCRRLVALIQSPDQMFGRQYALQEPKLKKLLVSFHWARLIPQCIRLMLGNAASTNAKEWVRSFYAFLDEEYTMKAFTSEVWVLSVSTKPLWSNGMSHWDIHKKYRVWWAYNDHTVRPLYIAFRVGGKLDSIYRVSRIEHNIPIIDRVPEMKNMKQKWPQTPCTIWHFGPPVSLGHTVRTGGGMYNRRVRCDLDLLLSCGTVQEIEEAMSKRRHKGAS